MLLISGHRLTVLVHGVVAAACTGAVVLAVRTEPAIADGTGGAGGGWVFLMLVAACTICAGVAVMTQRGRLDRRPGPRSLVAVAVAACILGGIGAVALDRVAIDAGPGPRVGGEPAANQDPAARLTNLSGVRDEVWASALRATGGEPLTGIGPGTFEFWWSRDDPSGQTLVDAHSLYIETLAELGLPGLVLLLGLLAALGVGAAAALRTVRRRTLTGLAVGLTAAFGAYLFTAGVDWMWESTAVTVLALSAALAAGGLATTSRSGRARLGPRRWLIVLLAVLAGAVQIPPIVAAERLRAAEASAAIGKLDEGQAAASDAVSAEPWSASAYAARAFLRLADGDVSGARSDAGTAAEREPTNWRHQLLRARIEIIGGEETAAREALARLEELRPALAPQVAAIEAELDLDQP